MVSIAYDAPHPTFHLTANIGQNTIESVRALSMIILQFPLLKGVLKGDIHSFHRKRKNDKCHGSVFDRHQERIRYE